MLDRKGKRRKWTAARSAEIRYNSQLRSVAKQVGMIVKGLAPDGTISNVGPLIRALRDYAKVIEPWAESVASFMLADVARRDRTMWRRIGKEMSRELRNELNNAPTGVAFQGLQAEQVNLIKSIPLEAAERVHQLSEEGLTTARRADYVAAQILKTQEVSEARATLIARTEVGRAATNLVRARAEHAGSQGYIWRTSGDLDVRDSHAAMEGVYVRWSHPPTLDNLTGHAGALPNCRCFPDPVFPDDD